MKRLKKNKNFFLIIFIIVIILIVITTVSFTLSYGYFKKDVVSANQLFKSGSFNITYSMGSAVTLDKTYPMSDRAGNATEANTITINNTGDYYACYGLTLTDSSSSQTLKKSQMKYSINKAVKNYENEASPTTLVLGGAAAGETIKLDYRTWIKDTETDETATKKSYSGTLKVESVSCNNTLGNEIFEDNSSTKTSPTLTSAATTSSQSGLYKVTTNNGTTYVYRGNVSNNYVSFAGKIWRIIRVNEDGTIRMILSTSANSGSYASNTSINKMRYNESDIKKTLDSWYETNLKTKESSIANSTFCDEFKVTDSSSDNYKTSATVNSSYTSTMNCKNPISAKIGLITYDEANFAGLHYSNTCSSCYLKFSTPTMSIAGYSGSAGKVWSISSTGKLEATATSTSGTIYPVISLNANVEVTGSGTSSDPYKIN